MTRPLHMARITGGLAIIAALASCQGSVARPTGTTPSTKPQIQFNSDGTIATCLAELVAFTTQVRVVGSPHTTSVEITSTLIDRGRFACALPQLSSACFADPTAEVTTTDGHLVWSPRNLVHSCPPRPGAAPVVISPGRALETTQTWDLTVCPVWGCLVPNSVGGSAPAVATPGNYVARGTSDTVGDARGATFTIR
jgi:hypothetical protein